MQKGRFSPRSNMPRLSDFQVRRLSCTFTQGQWGNATDMAIMALVINFGVLWPEMALAIALCAPGTVYVWLGTV